MDAMQAAEKAWCPRCRNKIPSEGGLLVEHFPESGGHLAAKRLKENAFRLTKEQKAKNKKPRCEGSGLEPVHDAERAKAERDAAEAQARIASEAEPVERTMHLVEVGCHQVDREIQGLAQMLSELAAKDDDARAAFRPVIEALGAVPTREAVNDTRRMLYDRIVRRGP